jgi:hypothetical protein
MKRPILFLLLLALALTGVITTGAQDDDTDADGDVAVTVYNQGTALIRDQRTFTFDEGVNTIDFTDVAAAIDPTSVSFVSITDPDGTVVLEQNYIYDLVNSSALLERYLDETIAVTVPDGDSTQVITGQLLSGRNNEIIIRAESGEIVVVRAGSARDIRFPDLPEGLITRPTLRWLVQSAQSGEQTIELTYLTGGLNWTADYNLLLNTDNTALDLNGWVTLNNTSGTTYQDAQLKLVAGDVNRIQLQNDEMLFMMEADMAMDTAGAPRGVEQREFFEYQLYEINRPVTIADNETKQVEFVTGTGIPANMFFVYDASQQFFGYGNPVTDQFYGQTGVTDVGNYVEFSTDEEDGLGADLPAGRVRFYQEDTDGAALLIGENRIDHTPQGEQVQFYIGNAFDLVGERTQTDYRLVSDTVLQESYEIRLRNRKDDETVEIRVPERLNRWSNWEILNASTEFEQLNAHAIEFRVDVPPGEEVVITYTVQYSWPRR